MFTTYAWRIKVYEDTYQDNTRIKAQVQRVDGVEWGKEGWVSLPARVNTVERGKEGWVSPRARVDAVEWGKE